MFNELVDKIVVYEAEGAGNARTQKVDIYFNYVGQVDIAYTEEELAELKAQKEQEERQRMEKQRKREKAYREKRKAKKIAENGGEIIKTKTCPHCGKMFTPTSNRQLFCSRDCWNQARQEQRKRLEKPREEVITTGNVPVPYVGIPTGLHTASRNFVPRSAGELTTTGKPWNSITRKKEI